MRTLGNDHGVMTCATDFIGMSEDDVGPVAIPALLDMSKFKPLPDRLQQGFLDFLYLGRAMIHPDGFSDDAAFKFRRRTRSSIRRSRSSTTATARAGSPAAR